mmetsp:Transcript_22111/g.61965  ORF Transcript_22111/g.61965 Transcript_22111/m.61965 type:complete len:221 (+) Transcript_22111:352-1014(+)
MILSEAPREQLQKRNAHRRPNANAVAKDKRLMAFAPEVPWPSRPQGLCPKAARRPEPILCAARPIRSKPQARQDMAPEERQEERRHHVHEKRPVFRRERVVAEPEAPQVQISGISGIAVRQLGPPHRFCNKLSKLSGLLCGETFNAIGAIEPIGQDPLLDVASSYKVDIPARLPSRTHREPRAKLQVLQALKLLLLSLIHNGGAGVFRRAGLHAPEQASH